MVSEQDFERLSAYIDGELSPDEQTALEQRLQREPALRRELDELRVIVQAVRGLPAVQRPRDFTLSPEMVGMAAPARAARFLLFPATPLVSALSSVAAALLLIGGGLLLYTAAGPLDSAVYAPAPVAIEPTAPAPQQAPVIQTARPTATVTETPPPTPAPAEAETDMEMAESADEAAESQNEAMAEAATLFDAALTATSAPPTATPGLERSAPLDDDAAGAAGALQATASPSPPPTQPVTPPPDAADAGPEIAPTGEAAPAPPLFTASRAAALLLALGGLLAVVAVGTFIQRRRGRGGA